MVDNRRGSNVRINNDLYKELQETASLKSRTISGQIEYWINLGKILEKKFPENEIKSMLLELKSLSNT